MKKIILAAAICAMPLMGAIAGSLTVNVDYCLLGQPGPGCMKNTGAVPQKLTVYPNVVVSSKPCPGIQGNCYAELPSGVKTKMNLQGTANKGGLFAVYGGTIADSNIVNFINGLPASHQTPFISSASITISLNGYHSVACPATGSVGSNNPLVYTIKGTSFTNATCTVSMK